jgi:hypothetical protein
MNRHPQPGRFHSEVQYRYHSEVHYRYHSEVHHPWLLVDLKVWIRERRLIDDECELEALPHRILTNIDDGHIHYLARYPIP